MSEAMSPETIEAVPTTPPAKSNPSNGANNKKMMMIGVVILIVVVLAGCVGIGIYRAYAKSATDTFTLTVARMLNLPAVKVNDAIISYSDYAEDTVAIHAIKAYDAAHSGPGADLSEQQMSDQVLMRLVNNALTSETAQKANITVTDKEISDFVDQVLLKQFNGNKVDAEKTLMERYHWTLAQYETKFIRPYLFQSKLTSQISADPAGRAAIKTQAQAVLDQIKKGTLDFAAAAKQYGQDGTAQQGGDLGWFGKGDMVPEFDTAVFSLKKGELDPELVQSQYGYHILQLEDTRVNKQKDAKGVMQSTPQVKARHILFMFPDASVMLNKSLKEAAIHLYVDVHNPFPDLQKGPTATTTTK